MITKEVTAQATISLNDFDVDDIIGHLDDIHLNREELEQLHMVLKNNKVLVRLEDAEPQYMFDNLGDQYKFQICKEAMQKYSIEDIQKRLA